MSGLNIEGTRLSACYSPNSYEHGMMGVGCPCRVPVRVWFWKPIAANSVNSVGFALGNLH